MVFVIDFLIFCEVGSRNEKRSYDKTGAFCK